MIRIGIICPSEIAFRRFMPALSKCEDIEFAGVAAASSEEWDGEYTCDMQKAEIQKAEAFCAQYGGKVFESYSSLISSSDVDAVYLPLPPALHFKWGKAALLSGKHLFLEKPSTVSLNDTRELVELAEGSGLALHENYMFRFHSQIDFVKEFISQGKIGDVRLYRIAFGFPQRAKNDFRYNKALGGGALLDCGGYTLRLASMLLGETAHITSCRLNYTDEFDVDIFGSATMENDEGVTAQLSFGMDNAYKCELEVWGSKGTLLANRILTAPAELQPILTYKNGNEPAEEITLAADDTFKKSIEFFHSCIENKDVREQSYNDILKQAQLVNNFERK